MSTEPRRLLLVHAHPDDETLGNGATMARYVAEGARVTLVTCTRGEQGEVIPPELARLTDNPDQLGDFRVGELTAAMAVLGVEDHRFLGDPVVPGRSAGSARAGGGVVLADSGMAYAPDGSVIPAPVTPEDAFALADLERTAGLLATVLREVRPHVVITYEPGGGYGHPDHVRAHRVTMRALELAALPGPESQAAWRVPKVYWTVQPNSQARDALSSLREAQGEDYTGPDPEGRLPSVVVPDSRVTTVIDARAHLPVKAEALRAHATQVLVGPDETWYELSNHVGQPLLGTEFYRLVRGLPGGPVDEQGRETDLFG